MSVIQPQAIYTGQNSARPDFKGMTRDIQARMAQVDRERQQQRQFDAQRQDQMNRDFMKTVDIDKLNFVDANLQQKSLNAYKQFDDMVSKMVQDKKGNLSTQDIMNGKAAASAIEQQMSVLKNWDNNRKQDIIAFKKDPGKYDQESFKEETLYWDTNTPYNESKLKIAPWELNKTQKVLKNKLDDEIDVQSRVFNKDKTQVKVAFNDQYWETEKLPNGMSVPKLDENGRGVPNYKNQGKRIKEELGAYDNIQGREGLVKGYSKLSASDQKMWDDLAMNNGLTTQDQGDVQGDGEIMWMLHPDGANKNPFQLDVGMSEKRPSTATKTTKKKDIDVRTGAGDMSGNPVKKTGRVSGAMNMEGDTLDVLGGKDKVLYTKVEYMTNPKTGKKEWMVYGQYDKPNPDLGEVAMGKRIITEEFLVPYEGEKELIEDEYIVKGMDTFKPKKEEEATVTYSVKGKVYNIPESETDEFLKSFPKAKKQ